MTLVAWDRIDSTRINHKQTYKRRHTQSYIILVIIVLFHKVEMLISFDIF